MTKLQKEQACYCMIEGCLKDAWYETWFIIAMKSMFKDEEDRSNWTEELAKRKEYHKKHTELEME